MSRILPAAAYAAAVVTATGCYHHHVLTFGGNAGNVNYWRKTVHAGVWGTYPKPIVPPAGSQGDALCADNGLHDVVVTSNFGYAAAAVVTLGLWSPVHVEWNCAAPIPRGGPTLGAPHVPSVSPIPAHAAALEFTNRNLHSVLWGVLKTDAKAPLNFPPAPLPGSPTPLNCAPNIMNLYGMRQVKIPVIPRNYFYSMATVMTLGLWSPMHVAWQCVAPPAEGPALPATHAKEERNAR